MQPVTGNNVIIDLLNKMKEVKIKCPNCGSTTVYDDSIYEDNGIIGPGYSSWKVKELYSCVDCGIVFKKTKENAS